jgi:hypothetical protein
MGVVIPVVLTRNGIDAEGIDATSCAAVLTQSGRRSPQPTNKVDDLVGDILAVERVELATSTSVKHLGHSAVGEAGTGRYTRFVDVNRRNVTTGAHTHLHRQCVAFDTWYEGEHIMSQLFGQHGAYVVRKVNRGRHGVSSSVDGRTGAHVFGDVGDVDPDADVTVRVDRGGDGVVEVPGVRGVDRNHQLVAKITAKRIANTISPTCTAARLGIQLTAVRKWELVAVEDDLCHRDWVCKSAVATLNAARGAAVTGQESNRDDLVRTEIAFQWEGERSDAGIDVEMTTADTTEDHAA